MALIRCRAKCSPDCYNGKPELPDTPMADDGTYVPFFAGADDPQPSIVCDACFLAVEPFTPSGKGLRHELPTAISHHHRMTRILADHDSPPELLAEAEAAMARCADPDTPRYRSARRCRDLAAAEVNRRATP